MSKILCVTSGLAGITNSSVELVKRLQSCGHNVEYASPRNIKLQIEQSEVKFYQLEEILKDPSPHVPRKGGISRLIYKWKNYNSRRKQAYEKARPSEFIGLIQHGAYDLLIIDMEIHEYIITAFEHKQNILLLSQWFSIWRRQGLPYILTDAIPQNGIKGSNFFTGLYWTKVKWIRKWIFFRRNLVSGNTNRSAMITEMAKRSKFPRRFIGDNYWPGPFLFEGLPVVSMTPEALEFTNDRQLNLTYLGPLVDENRPESTDPRLFNFIRDSKASELKIIYCSVSTLSSSDHSFLRKIIACGKNHPEWRIVISLGGKVEKDIFGVTTDNVLICDRVSQLYMLENADLSVNHGGIHTINECIVKRVPMLIYSGKKSDQNGSAARIHFHGLGLMADKDVDSEIEIAANIKEVLNNEMYLKKVNLIYQQYQNDKENKTVEKVINEYLSEEQ